MKRKCNQDTRAERAAVTLFIATLLLPRALAAREAGDPKLHSVAPIRFEDTSRRAAAPFVLRNSATPSKYQIEPMVAGVALFDYNNDGFLEIYFANGVGIPSLLRNSKG